MWFEKLESGRLEGCWLRVGVKGLVPQVSEQEVLPPPEHVKQSVLLRRESGYPVVEPQALARGIRVVQIVGHHVVVIVVHEEDVEVVGLVEGVDLLRVQEVASPGVVA